MTNETINPVIIGPNFNIEYGKPMFGPKIIVKT